MNFEISLLTFQNKDLKASGFGDTMSNRMKMEKLYEEFPAIDQSVLYEIFRGNWYVSRYVSRYNDKHYLKEMLTSLLLGPSECVSHLCYYHICLKFYILNC
jgi:hypothetical protein